MTGPDLEGREAKTVYVARACDGENFIVIAEHDGSYRRWKLTDLQIVKLARESGNIAFEFASGFYR